MVQRELFFRRDALGQTFIGLAAHPVASRLGQGQNSVGQAQPRAPLWTWSRSPPPDTGTGNEGAVVTHRIIRVRLSEKVNEYRAPIVKPRGEYTGQLANS